MKSLLIMFLMVSSTYALVLARFTGRSEEVKTVTGQRATRCEYQLPDNRKFWKTFLGYNCPLTVDVQ